MHVYRFKITSDENDDFLRVVDVLASQSFEDFHNVLYKTCAFKSNELASFYLCDAEWRKKKEFTLVDMNFQDDMSDDADFVEDNHLQHKVLMKNVKLNSVINDPHQRILYIYDFMKMITLNIELSKILDVDKNVKYPLVVESKSELNLVIPAAIKDMDFEDSLSDEDLDEFDEASEEPENFEDMSF